MFDASASKEVALSREAREGDRGRSCRPKNGRLATIPQACETYLDQDPAGHLRSFARSEAGVRSSRPLRDDGLGPKGN